MPMLPTNTQAFFEGALLLPLAFEEEEKAEGELPMFGRGRRVPRYRLHVASLLRGIYSVLHVLAQFSAQREIAIKPHRIRFVSVSFSTVCTAARVGNGALSLKPPSPLRINVFNNKFVLYLSDYAHGS